MSSKISFKAMKLTNFGRHENLDVEFSSTLTVLKGPNGSGKSTVLQGIFFALFGVSAVDGTAKDIPNVNAKDCEVVLRVQIGSETYSIGRTLKDAGVYRMDGELLASGHTSVNGWIVDKLGVTQKQFLSLAYSPQTETAAIMSIGAAELNRMVERLSGADFIGRVESKAGHIGTSVAIRLDVTEKPESVEELEMSIGVQSELRATLETALQEATAKHESAVEEYEKHAATLEEARKNARARKDLTEIKLLAEKTADRAQGRIDALAATAAEPCLDNDEIERMKARKAALLKEATDTEVECAEFNRLTERLQSARKRLEECPDYEALAFAIQPDLDAARNQLTVLVADKANALGARDRAKREYMDADKSDKSGVCGTCLRPYEGHDKQAAEDRLQAAHTALRDAEIAYDTAYTALATATTVKDKLQSRMPTEIELRKRHTLKEAVHELELAVKNTPFPTDIDTGLLRKEADEIGGKLLAERRHADAVAEAKQGLRKAQEDIEKSAETIATANARLSQIPEVDLNAETQKSSELQHAIHVAMTAINDARRDKRDVDTEISALEQRAAKARALTEERAMLERRAASFNGLSKYLRSNRATFMSELWDQLMLLTSTFVSEVTDGRIEQIGRTDSGDFYYVERGQRSAYARLAGGFKAIAGVGMRLALASLLPGGVSVLVLDEPSSELADDMAASLAGALRGQDRQIVLVTHRTGEEFAADTVLELS